MSLLSAAGRLSQDNNYTHVYPMIQALYQALQISVSWERVSEIHSIMELHSCISTHSLAGDSASPYIVPTSIAWCCAQPCLQAMHACAQCSTTSHSGVVLCASVYRRRTPTASTLHTFIETAIETIQTFSEIPVYRIRTT